MRVGIITVVRRQIGRRAGLAMRRFVAVLAGLLLGAASAASTLAADPPVIGGSILGIDGAPATNLSALTLSQAAADGSKRSVELVIDGDGRYTATLEAWPGSTVTVTAIGALVADPPDEEGCVLSHSDGAVGSVVLGDQLLPAYGLDLRLEADRFQQMICPAISATAPPDQQAPPLTDTTGPARPTSSPAPPIWLFAIVFAASAIVGVALSRRMRHPARARRRPGRG